MKKRSKKTAYVACQGGCRATAECQASCVGCGICVSVCPFEAIELNAFGVAVIDAGKCIGCGKCAKECPRGVIRVHDRGNPIIVACSNREEGK
ncbi:MAG: 4Fe-4S binding protein, partial [Oscillospiraceae bacterium]|nr:4Fe-4S binding protein [Oscillospiraceae bacterium]